MKAAICLFVLLALSATSCEAHQHGWRCWWNHHKKSVVIVEEPPEECASVAETAVGAELNTLVAALTAADLVAALGPEFVGTVFAPTEEAFVALLEALGITAEELLANTDLLTQVLLIHVVPDVVAFAADLQDGQQIPTAAEGVFVTVSINEEGIFIVAPSGVRAKVVGPDIVACDAVVHVIDAVLTPAPAEPAPEQPSAAAETTASAEATAVAVDDGVDDDGDDGASASAEATAVAVDDGADDDGDDGASASAEATAVAVDDGADDDGDDGASASAEATAVAVDDGADDDGDDEASATAEATATGDETTTTATTTVDEEPECTTVADTAINAGLGTLVAALGAADLAGAVGPEFNGTVFAPTEEAFAALLAELEVTPENLFANVELLTTVLLIHVVPDVRAFSTDLSDGQQIPTAAEGVFVTVAIEGNTIFIVAPSGVRAQVVTPDIVACDAVIHVIDAVLTPAP